MIYRHHKNVKMLGFLVVFALTVVCSQMHAEPTPQGYIDDYPTPQSYPKCPNLFHFTPYHYFCECNFDYCLDSHIESQAKILAQQTSFISLCDIQQLFILVENTMFGIDYDTEIDIVSQIVAGLESEIINGGYRPVNPPDYCTEFSNMDFTSPLSAFTSESAMNFYNSKINYFLWKTMPLLTEAFQQTIQNAVYYNIPQEFQQYTNELYYKLSICLRSILSNMIDTTPYVSEYGYI